MITNSDNTRKTWRVIKEIIGKSDNSKGNLPTYLNVNQKLVYDKTKIANELNNFFATVGENLAKKIPTSLKSPISYMKHFSESMNSTHLTDDELIKAFNSLKSNKSQGIDEIDVNVVQKTFDIIKIPLLYIFNLSLNTGTFPQSMKLARVTPCV